MGDFRAIPVPANMQHLPRDKRGYPIPYIVWIDSDGNPQFTVNGEELRQRVLVEDRCSICGNKLFRGHFLVGGPLSAFSANGRYIDPPMHRDCATYALKVCPYLAAPNYGKSIEASKIKQMTAKDQGRIFVDNTMMPGRPALFVLIGFPRIKLHKGMLANDKRGQRIVGWQYVEPKGQCIDVEFWQGGERLTWDQAQPMIDEAFLTAYRPDEKRRDLKLQRKPVRAPDTQKAFATSGTVTGRFDASGTTQANGPKKGRSVPPHGSGP